MTKEMLTIQEAAEKTGLSAHTLRYYEQIGLIGPIRRGSNGHRRYSEEDVNWVIFLKRLRAAGMPIATMLRYAALQRNPEETLEQRLEVLKEHEKAVEHRVRKLKDHLGLIKFKIEYYSKLKDPSQDECP